MSREELAYTETDVVAVARTLGYPVVLKASGNDILHKTEKGLICLDLHDEESVRAAFRAIAGITGGPVLVQEMVSGKREFMTGMKRFKGFGPAILFGFGGIFAEAVKDTSLRVPPFAMEDAEEMMAELRTSALLGEFRGMPTASKGRIAEIIQTLGFIALLHPEIQEMECNPIILQGSEPVAVDALAILCPGEQILSAGQ